VNFTWVFNDEKHGTMDQPMDAPLGGLLESGHTVWDLDQDWMRLLGLN
jgi:hypothetical protein